MENYLFFINFIFAMTILFFQRKDPRSTWAWLILLFALPGLGFFIYLIFGTDLCKKRKFSKKEGSEGRISFLWNLPLPEEMNIKAYRLMKYNYDYGDANLTGDNRVDILSRGLDKFASLLTDIENAKEYVFLEYYIIRNDFLFYEIFSLLQKKAREGVKICLLYDGMGCHHLVKRRLKNLKEKNVFSGDFFPAALGRLHLRINYRNHRKIAVIDGKIGYVGGFNIGKEYLGLSEKLGKWRDTHLRMEGSAVASLEKRFVLDWQQAKGEFPIRLKKRRTFGEESSGVAKVQIIASGPDGTVQNIRDNFLKMILMAEERIDIQSPYFVPDESILAALKLAVRSGVKVRIMIPCKPDHPFVYWATFSYIGEMLLAGAECYIYEKGFLHAKGILVDDNMLCYGTANMDIRSFFLNFEVNATIFGKKEAEKMRELFEVDLKSSHAVKIEEYEKRNLWVRARERISRMLSPIL